MGRMKGLVFVVLAILVLGIPLLSACGKTATTTPTVTVTKTATASPAPTTPAPTTTTPAPTTTTPAPTTTPPPTTTAKQIVLKISDIGGPPPRPMALLEEWFASELEKRTNGSVKAQVYYSQALAKATENWDAVKNGIADLGVWAPSYKPDVNPAATITRIPFLVEDFTVAYNAILDYFKLDSVQEEAKKGGVVYAWPLVAGPYYLASKKPVASLADLKGLRVQATGEFATALQKAGAIPAGIPTADAAVAIDKGTLDAAVAPPSALKAYGLDKANITKYVVDIGAGLQNGVVIAYPKTWDGLPANVKEIINQLIKEMGPKAEQWYIEQNAAAQKEQQAAGVAYSSWSRANKDSFRQVAAPLFQGWVDQWKAKGLPADQWLKFFQDKVAQYEKAEGLR